MANTNERKLKKLVWKAVTLSLKSRCSTCAARFSRCGCAYQAEAVAEAVITKNLDRLKALRIGDHAVFLQEQIKLRTW